MGWMGQVVCLVEDRPSQDRHPLLLERRSVPVGVPLCDTCAMRNISRICPMAKLSCLFDHPGTVFFSIFMSFWAMALLEHWKQGVPPWPTTGLQRLPGPRGDAQLSPPGHSHTSQSSQRPESVLGRAQTLESNIPGSKSGFSSHFSRVTFHPPLTSGCYRLGEVKHWEYLYNKLDLGKRPSPEPRRRKHSTYPPTHPATYLCIQTSNH
uniref:anoctamin-2 n=1 Tax=Macaca mulatta TaxID=9544 RepID=UPI0003AB9E97|nr:anoctamin-2 [Macaca mulatta]